MLATRMRMVSKPWNGYLYEEGNEWVVVTGGWVEGQVTNADRVSFYKNPNNLNVDVSSSGGSAGWAWGNFVIDKAVDLTDFNTLNIEWENTGSTNNLNRSVLIVGSKLGDIDDYEGRWIVQNAFSKKVTSENISAITGQHYVRFAATDVSSTTRYASNLFVYNVWLE